VSGSQDNYFICINPRNQESQSRINDFHKKMSKLLKLPDIDTNEQTIIGKRIWVMKNNRYVDNHRIPRYHRIFKINTI
jgi:hypothetical protein